MDMVPDSPTTTNTTNTIAMSNNNNNNNSSSSSSTSSTVQVGTTSEEMGFSLLSPPNLSRQFTSHLDSFSDGLDNDDEPKAHDNSEKKKSIVSTQNPITLSESNHEKLSSIISSSIENRCQIRCGLATDIGGGSVNQDDAEVLFLSQDVVVLGVFDGHGRELGELSSLVAKESIRNSLKSKGTIEKLREDPEKTMIDVFKAAHEAIREAFREKYLKANWEVQDTEDGYLVKRQNKKSPWTCTHGGTTATVVVILDGRRMIVANVGDSSAVWGWKNNDGTFSHIELSAEHSPESIEEYERVRKFRPMGTTTDSSGVNNHSSDINHSGSAVNNNNNSSSSSSSSNEKSVFVHSEMKFVYDAPNFSKNRCHEIFEVDEASSQVRVTGKGNYYKNVRNEWATLVTTPSHAKYQDALAFTRSLGDLHLHVYGVSETPSVVEYDLFKLHASSAINNSSIDSAPKKKVGGVEIASVASVLLVCTDGVWDNWKYSDLVACALREPLAEDSFRLGNAQKATDEIMAANVSLAKTHFGSQADNMTAIVCYVYL